LFRKIQPTNLTNPKFQVYKLMGPILVKQSLVDSQQNVSKRIDFINKELQKCNDQLNSLETHQDKQRETIQKLQQQLILLK
jgi:prefoldin beta subunit